jgi:hypothetical protein
MRRYSLYLVFLFGVGCASAARSSLVGSHVELVAPGNQIVFGAQLPDGYEFETGLLFPPRAAVVSAFFNDTLTLFLLHDGKVVDEIDVSNEYQMLVVYCKTLAGEEVVGVVRRVCRNEDRPGAMGWRIDTGRFVPVTEPIACQCWDSFQLPEDGEGTAGAAPAS